MANLKEVRGRIVSVKSTQQITKAMKMVAAAKLRRAQNRMMQMRPYAQKLSQILQNVTASLVGDDFESEYSAVRTEEKILIVTITSDKGLCGAFNTYVLRAMQGLLDTTYSKQNAQGNVTVMPIGKRALDYVSRRKIQSVNEYSDIFSQKELTFDYVRQAAEYAMEHFVEENFDKVEIVYNEFKNVATQIVRVEQFLPIVSLTETAEVKSTKPSLKKKEEFNTTVDYVFEPGKKEILADLIPQSLKTQFYSRILESNASEQGARMTAMDKATENAGELLKDLKLSYNRARQANITKEILEIVGGAEALEQG
ncbi:ATP synthase F1 subcomplex gamma subunit [Bernardetia litoralis DSM 6794]|uniref:ATP synthase gamma chain n=1 Tax=Bernardetia litoralis (strain ATCC 23117 / DSM 6794 / NBRC 15988 / NCIMB 1366 / Fx l1 / Sio-4) TaxID=880071 RepID=I4AMY5_BERLS|nr:ATP synthase F1 subunit gamma [Bernardetia litoralis]AFM05320.1 ATP synthase F1 subcomplex gamma subunit [Bernardetia litoralis DSM 6794]